MRTQGAYASGWTGVSASRADEKDRAVEALFDQHYDHLCHLAFLIMGDAHLGEEIVMEALLKVYAGWGRIRNLERSDAYLRRAVVNLCRSRIRRKTVERRVNALVLRTEETRAPEWDPEVHERNRELWTAVRRLPVRQRAAIVLRYLEDLPEGDIAEVLDCSVGTVRSQLSRARVKLERFLAEAREEAGS